MGFDFVPGVMTQNQFCFYKWQMPVFELPKLSTALHSQHEHLRPRQLCYRRSPLFTSVTTSVTRAEASAQLPLPGWTDAPPAQEVGSKLSSTGGPFGP